MLLNLKGASLAIKLHVDRKALLFSLVEGSAICHQSGGLPVRYRAPRRRFKPPGNPGGNVCVGQREFSGRRSGSDGDRDHRFLDGILQPMFHAPQNTRGGRFKGTHEDDLEDFGFSRFAAGAHVGGLRRQHHPRQLRYRRFFFLRR